MPVAETRDLDDNTVADFDTAGNVRTMTMEHASERAGLRRVSLEQVSAWRAPSGAGGAASSCGSD